MGDKQYWVYMLTNRWRNFEQYDEIDQTIAREKQIQGWIRAKKNALIEAQNPEWKDLAADWFAPHREGVLRFAQDDTEAK